MSIRLRFLAWQIVVALALVAQPIVLLFTSSRVMAVVLLVFTMMIIGLLVTTPSDAIKLKRHTSERMLVGGTVLLGLLTIKELHVVMFASQLFLGVIVLFAARRLEFSAWWAMPILWCAWWAVAR